MKKLVILFLSGIVFSYSLKAQCNVQMYDIYTPNNSLVVTWLMCDEHYTERESEDIYYSIWYSEAKQIITFDGLSSTSRFNCHGFAWLMTRRDSTRWLEGDSVRWIGLNIYESGLYPDVFIKDGSYIEVPPGTHPAIVFWDRPGDHSAITTSHPDTVISKWNAYPLMKHHLKDGSFGTDGSNVKYYVMNPSPIRILGPYNVCPSDKYTIKSGQVATWSVSAGFSITPTDGGVSAIIKATEHNGQIGTVTAVVNGDSTSRNIQACDIHITGFHGVIPGFNNFSINTGQPATWSISPNDSTGFSISTTYGAHTIVTASPAALANGQTGTITAVLDNGISVTKDIKAYTHISIIGPDVVTSNSTIYSINTGHPAYWYVDPISSFQVFNKYEYYPGGGQPIYGASSSTTLEASGSALSNGVSGTITALLEYNMEYITKDITASSAITGPDYITPSGTYSISSSQSATWSVSSEFIITPSPDGKSATVKPQYFNGACGTVTAVVNGVTLTKPIQHVYIVGTGMVSSPVAFSLNTGQSATWSVTPNFCISTNGSGATGFTATGTTVIATFLSGNSHGLLTAELADGTVITKGISEYKAPNFCVAMYTTSDIPITDPPLNILAFFHGGYTPLGATTQSGGGSLLTGYFNNPGFYCNCGNIWTESSTYITEYGFELFPINFGVSFPWSLWYDCTVEIYEGLTGVILHYQTKSGICNVGDMVNLFDDGWRMPTTVFGEYMVTVYLTLYTNAGKSGSSGISSINVKAYPNPVSYILNIEIDQQAQSSTSIQTSPTYAIRLYDGQGNLLRFAKTKGVTVQFDVSSLLDGIYYLHVYDEISGIPEILQIMVER